MIHLSKQVDNHSTFNLGVEAYNNRRFLKASQHFKKAIEEHPNYADYHFALAMTLREMGEIDQAIASLNQALKINSNYVQAKNELAILMAMQGEDSTANDLFGEAVSQFIYNTEGSPGTLAEELLEDFRRGIQQLTEGGYADAVVSFRQATNPKPGMAQTHFNDAVELFLNEELEEAKIQLEQALKIDEYMLDAHMLRAKIAWMEGNFEDALHACRRAVELAPNYPDLRFHLAQTYRALERDDEARGELLQALEINPSYGQALLEISAVAIDLGDTAQAEQSLRTYSECGDSGHPRYDFLMGRLHEEQGQISKARTYYFGIADDSLWGAEARERLQEIENMKNES